MVSNFKRAFILLLTLVGLLSSGCQTPGRANRERSIDEELTKGPAPRVSPSEEIQESPRPGFEQEPEKAQKP